jgi:hypothetical protein
MNRTELISTIQYTFVNQNPEIKVIFAPPRFGHRRSEKELQRIFSGKTPANKLKIFPNKAASATVPVPSHLYFWPVFYAEKKRVQNLLFPTPRNTMNNVALAFGFPWITIPP